ncbi:MAG: gliding motility-associated C-terminal domain-containing protein [bacterium]|nr:gliding motility-associated C-terminal domain-containing protein [Candidatus Limimorpha equi]
MKRKLFTVLVLMFAFAFPAMATHQRAAEITYKWLGGNAYEFTLTCYTYSPSPAGLQRDSLLMNWGDGFQDYVPRVVMQNLGDDYTLNIYKMRHDYSSAGTYVISMEDANRNYGVVNIQNSVTIPMYIETELVINPFLGNNNSVQLLNAPVDKGCVGKLYLHNPAAYDPDGDSLSYRLLPCKGFNGEDIPSFTYPQASSTFEMDPVTGELHWENPMLQGEYNVAFIVEEWRGGVKIGSVIRDMQILIAACDNDLPEIHCLNDTCVEAGQQLFFSVSASDPNNNSVELTASGAPFELTNNPAMMDPETAIGLNPSFDFIWNTDCVHVRRAPYQLVFHAKDNGHPVSLTNVKTVSVTVIGPKVMDLYGSAQGNDIQLSWSPYACQHAVALRIYRKIGCDGYEPDACETGIRPGFQMIAEITDISSTSFTDFNLAQGATYCYRIVAVFHDGAESKVSDAVCVSLKNDLPLMTQVSNNPEDLSSGHVLIKWVKPTDIDAQYTPPFHYQLKRNLDGAASVVYSGNDTVFMDNSVNLALLQNLSYQVEMNDAQQQTMGESAFASAVFLTATGGDEKVTLQWTEDVPWIIDSTQIFRQQENRFVKIATTAQMNFVDSPLENDRSYSYYVCTFGHYSLDGIVSPLMNYSSIVSATPNDNEPPERPILEIETDCDAVSNLLTWQKIQDEDLAGFRIYHTTSLQHDFELLTKIDNPTVTEYLHEEITSVVGCYYVVAFDVKGNQSQPSDTLCVDYETCPIYELPNVFTPNSDGYNDLFVPIHAQLSVINHVKMVIFNRWGNVLLETSEPMINWNGKNSHNNQPCPDGTYFYVCEVKFQGLEGEETMKLQGSITIIK